MNKKYYFSIAVLLSVVSVGALANDIYVEQVGANNTITIVQDGAGNKVNGGGGVSSTTNAYINTDGATILIEQIGAQNILALNINNPNIASGMTVTSRADGSGNEQTISCGSALAANCNATTITQEINGSNNVVSTTLSGGAVSSIITVAGSYNAVTHAASGVGAHTANISVTGSGTAITPNTVSVTQTGTTAKNVTLSSDGSNNNISVTQSD